MVTSVGLAAGSKVVGLAVFNGAVVGTTTIVLGALDMFFSCSFVGLDVG